MKCIQMLMNMLCLQNHYSSFVLSLTLMACFVMEICILEGHRTSKIYIFFQLYIAEYRHLHINHTACMHVHTHTYALCVYAHIYPTIMENENAFCIVKLFDKTNTILHSSDYYASALFKIY